MDDRASHASSRKVRPEPATVRENENYMNRYCLYLRLLLTVVTVLMGSSTISHGQDGSDSSITLILLQPEHFQCGNVSINGVTDANIVKLVWDWGDGTGTESFFPASHRYSKNGTYTVQVTAHSSSSETETATSALEITNAESQSCESKSVLVANFVNGNNLAFNSRVYLFNPSQSAGNMTARVFTLPVRGGTAQELTASPLDLGNLGANSAMNIKLAEDILTPLGITLPYTDNDGDLTLEFTIEAADVRGATQVFSSSLAFGTNPLQEIPSTSSGSPTVLVANFMNGNDAVFNSRVYLFNPSPGAGAVTVRVFTLPLAGGAAQELTGTPLNLGTLGAKSALNVKLAEDILTSLGIPTPYITDGGNLTLEFTIQAADVRGAAQVFSSSFAFGVYPMQEFPFTSSGSPTVLVANFMNGNNAAFNSRVYLWNPSQSAGDVTVRVFTLPLAGGLAQELTGTPLNLGTLGAKSALNVKLVEDILTPLGIPTPYITDGGNLSLEFTIQAADVRGAAQVFSSSFAFGTNPLLEIPSTSSGGPTVLVANFTNGNNAAFNSRVYLWNPSQSAGNVTVRVFTLPLIGGLAQELTGTPLNLGNLGAKSALNVKLAEDILTPLGITTPYITDGGNLTLRFTIQAADVRGAAQVFSSDFAFGTYPLQGIVGQPTAEPSGFLFPGPKLDVGSLPRSVAVADLNSDGVPDLVTANRFSDDVSVLLGSGDGTFQAQQTFPAGNFPESVAVADLNNDGAPDLVTANLVSNDVSVLLGSGDGTFQPQQTFPMGLNPFSVAVADLNSDGAPDLVTANRGSDDVSVLLGSGDGTFQAQQTFPAGNFPESVVVADLNADGALDLVTSNLVSNDVSVLLGSGDGTFQAQQTFPAGTFPESVAVADLNADGIPDLVTANRGSGNVSVLLGSGDGTFGPQQTFPVGDSPNSVAVADLNADGAPDLVTANFTSNNVSVLLGNGDGTFGPQQVFAVGDGSIWVAVADLNNDGAPDLVTANGNSDDVSVLLGSGDGTFGPQQVFAVGDGPVSVAVADLNNDGAPDLVTVNVLSDDVSVLLGSGDGTFQPQQTFPVGRDPRSVAVADLNNDGAPDLVTANDGSGDVSVLLGSGDGTFQPQQTFAAGSQPSSVAVADLNNDGAPDLVTANASSNDVSVLLHQ